MKATLYYNVASCVGSVAAMALCRYVMLTLLTVISRHYFVISGCGSIVHGNIGRLQWQLLTGCLPHHYSCDMRFSYPSQPWRIINLARE